MADDEIRGKILAILDKSTEPISTLDLAKQLSVDRQTIDGAISSIISKTSPTFLKREPREYKKFDLTQEGQVILENGSHEARIYKIVKSSQDGIDQPTLMKSLNEGSGTPMAKAGCNKAMSNGWITMDKETKKFKPVRETIDDSVHDLIKSINSLSLSDGAPTGPAIDTKVIADLKKRKLITESPIKFYIITKGPDFATTIEEPEVELTTDLLKSGDWRSKKFKELNFDALGRTAERGHLHSLMKIKESVQQTFQDMGFAEMPTNKFVESSFWCFDTLVVPQAHPARDSQDTFFVSNPETCHPISDEELVRRVREAHHGTEDGSWPKGYQYVWSDKESYRNVLRTHTTAITARMLYKIAQDHKNSGGPFKPAKLFSIDRVFRNETLDQTHLAEFHQVEGVIVAEGLSLSNLKGVLAAFFERLGVTQDKELRFKSAYNPYTEPSMEIFGYHSGLGKYIELGNSGMFRPEMLTALGLPESVSAIAWGLSLERPAMIKYKIDNIRDLVGHKVDLKMVHSSPLCILGAGGQ